MRHDEQFFDEFYLASYGRTVALVAAITGTRHEAEDVAQEAYARALAMVAAVASPQMRLAGR